MTPTLLGRWQTRLLLFGTIGVLVTLPFYLGIIGTHSSPIFYSILAYLTLFGLGWDILYHYLQKFRWDYDWPGAFQLLAGIWEAAFLVILLTIFELPGVSRQEFDLRAFAVHYSCVWLAIYIAAQTLMRILFPRWRFKGGQWL